GHDVGGANAPATVWNLAEGYTGAGFQEFVTVFNPNPAPVHADATFFLPDGSTRARGIDLPPTSRATLDANSVVPPGSESSLQLTSSGPVVAERPIYFAFECPSTCMFRGGHNAMGATALSPTWFFAEGYTGKSPTQEFREYITIENPNPSDVTVPITFLLKDGSTIGTTRVVKGTSRATVTVADVVGDNQEVSAQVGPASAPIVAERPMYWGAPFYAAIANVDTVTLYSQPGGPVIGSLPNYNAEGGIPYMFRVLDQAPGWHYVELPTRPNMSAAWVSDDDVAITGVRHRIVVHLSSYRMELYDYNTLIANW